MRDTQYRGNSLNFGALQNKRNAGAEGATFYNILLKTPTNYSYLGTSGEGTTDNPVYAYRARFHQAQAMLEVLMKQYPNREYSIHAEETASRLVRSNLVGQSTS